MQCMHWYHITLGLYCIASIGRCGGPTSKKLMRGIGIAMQCPIIWVHFPNFWCALPKSACITICNALVLLIKCASLKQCNTNTRPYIVLFHHWFYSAIKSAILQCTDPVQKFFTLIDCSMTQAAWRVNCISTATSFARLFHIDCGFQNHCMFKSKM